MDDTQTEDAPDNGEDEESASFEYDDDYPYDTDDSNGNCRINLLVK